MLVLLVDQRTGRAASAGFLVGAALLPQVVAGPLVGAALDRVRRPRLFAALAAAGFSVATALLFAVAGRVPLPLAALVAVTVGCVEPIVVALSALLPRIVPAAGLARAYGLESASYNVAGIIGPGIAAGLAAWRGPATSGVVVVAIAVAGAGLAMLVPVPGPAARPGRTRLRALVFGGVVVLVGSRPLRAVTVSTSLAFLGIGGVPVIAVLLARHLGNPAAAGGQLVSIFAVGALAGSLASARWLHRRAELLILRAMVVLGLALAVAAAVPSFPLAMACFALAGVCDGPMLAATLALRQRESPPDRLGQVNTTGGSLKLGAAAVGAALTGALADRAGAGGLLLAAGFVVVSGALAGALLLARGRPAEVPAGASPT